VDFHLYGIDYNRDHYHFKLQMASQQVDDPEDCKKWERSDSYHNSFLIPKDDILDAVVKNNVEQGLPNIAVAKAQGKFLHLLAKSIGAKKILEVGTLGG
jgi:predicted O-methyltransferase YrrM